MAIKVSYYGSKKPAPNVKPQRVINLADNTPRDKLPFGGNNPLDWMTGKRQFQLKKEEPVEIKTGKSVTLSEDGVIELKGDSNTPGDSKVYSTDESGNRGWHDAPKSIPDGTADGQLILWDATDGAWKPSSDIPFPDFQARLTSLAEWLQPLSNDSAIGILAIRTNQGQLEYWKIPIGSFMVELDSDYADSEYATTTEISRTHVYGKSLEYLHKTWFPDGIGVPGGPNEHECNNIQLFGFNAGHNETDKTLAELLKEGTEGKNKCKVLVRMMSTKEGRPFQVPVLTYVPIGDLEIDPGGGGGDPVVIPEPDAEKGGITNGKSINFNANGAYQIYQFFAGTSDGKTLSELVDPETLPAVKGKYKLLARKDEITGPEVAYIDIGDLGALPEGTDDGQILVWDDDTGKWIINDYPLPLANKGDTLVHGEDKWEANPKLRWDTEKVEDGRLVLDYSEASTRDWDAPMPGITFKQKGQNSLSPGLLLNLEDNDPTGNRLDLGWGGAGGGNFELYSKDHQARKGQFKVIYGGGSFGSIQFVHYDGSNWRVVGGYSKEGRFICGLSETGFPGTADASELDESPPLHPLQVYNEGTDLAFAVTKGGRLILLSAAETLPSSLPDNSMVLWRPIDDNFHLNVELVNNSSAKKSLRIPTFDYSGGVPNNAWLIWSETGKVWKPSTTPPFPPTDTDTLYGVFRRYRSLEVQSSTYTDPMGLQETRTFLQLYGFKDGENPTETDLAGLLNSGGNANISLPIRYSGESTTELGYLPIGRLAGLLPSSSTTGHVLTWNGSAWVGAAPSGGGGGTPPAIPDPDTVKGGITNGKSINFNANGAYQIYKFLAGTSDEKTLSELVDPETLPADKAKYKLLARKDETTGPEVAYIDIDDIISGPPIDPNRHVVWVGHMSELTMFGNSPDEAEDTSWVAGNPEGKGLSEYVLTRVAYNADGDQKLYAFYRERVYDQYGRLFSVGKEERKVINTPVL